MPKRFYELQRLHVYDEGGRNSVSGITATIFGATSPLGAHIGNSLTRMGSPCVYPYRKQAGIWDNRVKELKTTADLGYKSMIKLQDFTSERELTYSMANSNVAISTVGDRVFYKTDAEIEEANIRIPMAIANSVKNSPHIKRFVYVSCAGADPNSHSKRLRTKWIGEQEVKAIYPDVTILRPTMMFNLMDANPTISGKWSMQMKMFNRMAWQIEGQNAKVQPVYTVDVALAAMNCLKMEETIGQSYDLGGPHTYNYQEIYEMFFDICQVKPYTSVVKFEDAYYYYHLKAW
jgi:NADH dehydrogenase (ubiquinone) 1 alpha subcomplex subunit 9